MAAHRETVSRNAKQVVSWQRQRELCTAVNFNNSCVRIANIGSSDSKKINSYCRLFLSRRRISPPWLAVTAAVVAAVATATVAVAVAAVDADAVDATAAAAAVV